MKLFSARIFALALAVGLPAFAQYGGFGGPSILSRGSGGSGRTGSNPVGFRWFAGASGNYFTNLNNPTLENGTPVLQTTDAFGASAHAGIQGYTSTARSSTSLDLGLNYYWSRRVNVSRGLSESISFTHSRQLTRRVNWMFGAQAQSTNRSLSFANSTYSPEPIPELTPQEEEIFDNRTYRANIGTGVSFQKSARLSFSAQVGAFGNERKSKRLISSRGFMGSAGTQYMLTRRQYIGASFSYGTFYFPGSYGESRFYSPQVSYGVTLSKIWSFNASAGLYSAHTDRLRAVPLDPFIVELTGQRTALEIFKGDNRGFSGGVSITGNYQRWGISMYARRGLRPGNGIYLTSESTMAGASVSRTLSRTVTWSLYARGSETKALTQEIGKARFYSAGTSFGYRINNLLHVNSSVGVYRTRAAGRNIEFDRFTATVGLYLSPGEIPLQIF